MKSGVFSRACVLGLFVALVIPAAQPVLASPETSQEPKCGAAFYKAWAKTQSRIRKFSAKHIVSTCDGSSAAELGPDFTAAVQKIVDNFNKQVENLGGEFFCDPQLAFFLPATVASFLEGQSTGEAYLNAFVSETCDEVPL